MGGLIDILSDIVLADLFGWLADLLPRPIRVGCDTLVGFALAMFVFWYFFLI